MKRLLILFLIVSANNLFAQSWHPLGSGVTSANGNDHIVRAMIVDSVNDLLIVAGAFDSSGGKFTQGIAGWNHSEFDTLTGLSDGGLINKMIYYNGNLFFGTIGSVSSYANGILELIALTNDDVNDFAVYDGNLIITGDFTKINGHVCNHIAYWNGAQWNDFGNGLTGFFPNGESLAVYHGELIVGGHFDHADGVPCNNIAAWNGSQWHALGVGVSCGSCFTEVSTMQVFHDSLYTGGSLDSAGGIYTGTIATWDGNNWHKQAIYPLCGEVKDLKIINDTLYACGWFTLGITFNCPANKVAQWTGSEWRDLNYGSSGGMVQCMAYYDNQLYIGGDFPDAGGIEVNNIAYMTGTTGFEEIETSKQIAVYPNPTEDVLHLKPPTSSTITILNTIGQTVLQLQATVEEDIDVTNLPAGIYLLRIKTPTGEQTVKFVKE